MKIIYNDFTVQLEHLANEYAKNGIFVITDKNVSEKVLPSIDNDFNISSQAKIFIIEPNEKSKSINQSIELWQWLIDNNANRNSLIINIGGGVVSDIGGFVASTFKRGCDFVNIPTTLLAMVDASIGGKTGINFNNIKNIIGVITDPKMVLINTKLLKSLPRNAIMDGYAEMLKYGFIHDPKLLNNTYGINLDDINEYNIMDIIRKDIEIKELLALKDKYDQNERRALNFGHTLGHSFETLLSDKGTPTSHGTAVAWGMIGELYLSTIRYNFPTKEIIRLHHFVKEHYPILNISCKDFEQLYQIMKFDKKNTCTQVNFTLLEDIGKVKYNQTVSKEEIFEALEYIFG